MTLIIRDATPADRDTIADYNSRLSQEMKDGPLDSTLIVPGVTAVLADRSKGRYWLAEIGDKIIGQHGDLRMERLAKRHTAWISK